VHTEKSEDEDNCCKADDSLKSFIFTLNNPDNVAVRKFAWKAEMSDRAIVWHDHFR
jgi:hypothetical protein